jgi:phage-related protein
VKPVTFLGDSLKVLRGFPDDARRDAGFQKTSEKTPKREIDIAAKRLRDLLKDRK